MTSVPKNIHDTVCLFHYRTVEATEIQELLLNRKNDFRQRGNLLLASQNAQVFIKSSKMKLAGVRGTNETAEKCIRA
jgi:hypothetical protein